MSYESELREVVLALDVRRMRELDDRWLRDVDPLDDILLLAVMHKIRLGLRGIPEVDRATSRRWLTEQGYRPDVTPGGRRTTRASEQIGSMSRRGSRLVPVGPPCS